MSASDHLSKQQFKRVQGGYLHPSGDYYLERMARMSTGNTNGWAIHERTPEEHVGRDDTFPYHTRTGDTLTDVGGTYYHHTGDEGSLGDAKFAVEHEIRGKQKP